MRAPRLSTTLRTVAMTAWLVATATAQTPRQFSEQRGGHFPRDTDRPTDVVAADFDRDGDTIIH